MDHLQIAASRFCVCTDPNVLSVTYRDMEFRPVQPLQVSACAVSLGGEGIGDPLTQNAAAPILSVHNDALQVPQAVCASWHDRRNRTPRPIRANYRDRNPSRDYPDKNACPKSKVNFLSEFLSRRSLR